VRTTEVNLRRRRSGKKLLDRIFFFRTLSPMKMHLRMLSKGWSETWEGLVSEAAKEELATPLALPSGASEELATLAAGASEELISSLAEASKEKLATLPAGVVVVVEESSLLFALWTTIARFIRRVIYCGRIAMAVPYLPYGKQ